MRPGQLKPVAVQHRDCGPTEAEVARVWETRRGAEVKWRGFRTGRLRALESAVKR